mmetsp:Transcript_11299/g.35931  ORF Transcript_11299/g.35931 Transcript_11299/m.35931 type:complete len:280 (+) Transcript_11299:474-1313(+)
MTSRAPPPVSRLLASCSSSMPHATPWVCARSHCPSRMLASASTSGPRRVAGPSPRATSRRRLPWSSNIHRSSSSRQYVDGEQMRSWRSGPAACQEARPRPRPRRLPRRRAISPWPRSRHTSRHLTWRRRARATLESPCHRSRRALRRWTRMKRRSVWSCQRCSSAWAPSCPTARGPSRPVAGRATPCTSQGRARARSAGGSRCSCSHSSRGSRRHASLAAAGRSWLQRVVTRQHHHWRPSWRPSAWRTSLLAPAGQWRGRPRCWKRWPWHRASGRRRLR